MSQNQKLFNKLFRYDTETGNLYRKISTKTRRAGVLAGFWWSKSGESEKRRKVMIRKKIWSASHVVWIMHNGDIPDNFVIDHLNGDCGDDRIENLRLATFEQNARNRKRAKTNTSGVAGVSFDKSVGKWTAYIHNAGSKFINLGRYKDKEHAIIARRAAEKVLGYISREGEVG